MRSFFKIFVSSAAILLTLPLTMIFLYVSIAKAISDNIIEKIQK